MAGAFSRAAGGGLTDSGCSAGALATQHDVRIAFRGKGITDDYVRTLLPDGAAMPTVLPAWTPRRRLLGEWMDARGDRRLGRVIVQSPRVPRFTMGRHATLLCEFPFESGLTPLSRLRLTTWSRVVANSQFTAGWIRRYWGREAGVLWPTMQLPARSEGKGDADRPREPWILGIGRFTSGSRSKQQLRLVEMFRELRARGGCDDWQLHLVGFPESREYVDQVREAVAGLPVHLHLAVEQTEVHELLARSRIFWHAVGVDVDPEVEPSRLEHFGIVTIEAMAAGCVPVVINRGGQPEIVRAGGGADDAGVLWDTPADAVRLTHELIADDARGQRLSSAAKERSTAFTFDRFVERALAVFG